MPDDLHARGAVHLGGLDQFLVDACDGSQIHDRGPSGILPGQPQPHLEPHVLIVQQIVDRPVDPSHALREITDDAVTVEDGECNGEHQHPADEVRERRNGLNKFLVRHALDLIQEDREDHREPGKEQADAADRERIAEHFKELFQSGGILHHVYKPFECHEFRL